MIATFLAALVIFVALNVLWNVVCRGIAMAALNDIGATPDEKIPCHVCIVRMAKICKGVSIEISKAKTHPV